HTHTHTKTYTHKHTHTHSHTHTHTYTHTHTHTYTHTLKCVLKGEGPIWRVFVRSELISRLGAPRAAARLGETCHFSLIVRGVKEHLTIHPLGGGADGGRGWGYSSSL